MCCFWTGAAPLSTSHQRCTTHPPCSAQNFVDDQHGAHEPTLRGRGHDTQSALHSVQTFFALRRKPFVHRIVPLHPLVAFPRTFSGPALQGPGARTLAQSQVLPTVRKCFVDDEGNVGGPEKRKSKAQRTIRNTWNQTAMKRANVADTMLIFLITIVFCRLSRSLALARMPPSPRRRHVVIPYALHNCLTMTPTYCSARIILTQFAQTEPRASRPRPGQARLARRSSLRLHPVPSPRSPQAYRRPEGYSG